MSIALLYVCVMYDALWTKSLRRRVTPQSCFLTDGKDQWPVHMQCINRHPSGGCQPHGIDPFPPEVLMPHIASWVIQRHFVATLRIDRCLTGRFVE